MLVARAAGADTPIEWSPARLLTWDDFLGPVPANADRQRVAATAASLAWSYEYALERSGRSCLYRLVSIGSAAQFHPETSWARPEHRNAAILAHEQGHFDIAQIYKERFRSATRELVGQTHRCRGRSERRSRRNAEREIEKLVGSIYEDVWRSYRNEQEAYDAATRHGIDTEAQAEWSAKIATLLGR